MRALSSKRDAWSDTVRRVTDQGKRTVVAGEGLFGEAFCDVTLTGIAWKDEGVDLVLELPDKKLVGSATACLVCRWLRSMVITLDLNKNPGAPLTWQGEVTGRQAGGFRLALHFGSSGDITIDCESLELHGRA
jgi:hypothetical protein